MSRTTIELEGGDRFRPGDTIKGRVLTPSGDGVEGLQLRLFWMTRGRGTEETKLVAIQQPRGQGSKWTFQFELPVAPPSFSGTLVSVVWALELVDGKGDAVACREFVMSPTGMELILGKVEKPRHRQRKSMWKRNP